MSKLSTEHRERISAALREKPKKSAHRAALSTARRLWRNSPVCIEAMRLAEDGHRLEWENHIWARYRLTSEDIARMWEAQGGLCVFCQQPLAEGNRGNHHDPWNIDHDHANGRARGLLCHQCNRTRIPAMELLGLTGLARVVHYLGWPV